MTTQRKTTDGDSKEICTFCGKTITRTSSLESGHGARCQFIRAEIGDQNAQIAHRTRFTDASIAENQNYVKLADVSRSIKNNGITTVSRFVRAFGTDRNATDPKHISLTPIYTPKRVRYIHRFWATKSGQTKLATNQFGKISKTVTTQATDAVAKATGKKITS